MSSINRLKAKFRALVKPSEGEREMSREMQAHLSLLEEDFLRRGIAPADARKAALRKFGGEAIARERHRDARGLPWLSQAAQDARYALRSLRKNPGFTFIALATLTLGIGANTAIFTVVNTVLLRPLPYPDADRIVSIGRTNGLSNIPMFTYWERSNHGFTDLTAFEEATPVPLGDEQDRQLAKVAWVSKNYFRVFGALPVLGRTIEEADDKPGAEPVAVLSYAYWQSRLGGDRGVLGRNLRIRGKATRIVGVTSPGFQPYPDAEMWVPLQADPNDTNQAHLLWVVGRLPAGTTLQDAAARMTVIGKRFEEEHPEQLGGDGQLVVKPLQRELTDGSVPLLSLMLGAVGLVLLIACVNVASLLLGRATVRQRELAVRAAIGANRGRIVRQMLTESTILSLTGGVLGLAFGSWVVGALLSAMPDVLPRTGEVAAVPALDPAVALFTLGVALLTGVFFGMAPAMESSRLDLVNSLRQSGGAALRHQRVRSALVSAEVAIAVLLLAGAALLLRSFAEMYRVSLGFSTENVLTLQAPMQGPAFATSQQVDLAARQIIEEVRRVPGVERAAAASALPLSRSLDMVFDIPGRPPQPGFKFTGSPLWEIVSPDYFETLEIPVLRGRGFEETEPRRVAVINRAMANRYWPGEDPLGATILIGNGAGAAFEQGPVEIVGIVGDVRDRLNSGASARLYQVAAHIPDGAMKLVRQYSSFAMIVRMQPGADENETGPAISKMLENRVDAPVTSVQWLDEVASASVARENLSLFLVGTFAVLALVLASVGIYGVMAYTVTQRTREIGIRTAMGAAPAATVGAVLRQALGVAGIGLGVGVAGALALSRLLSSQLFGITTWDPVSYGSAALVLLAVALMAAAAPAWRASRVNPATALRGE